MTVSNEALNLETDDSEPWVVVISPRAARRAVAQVTELLMAREIKTQVISGLEDGPSRLTEVLRQHDGPTAIVFFGLDLLSRRQAEELRSCYRQECNLDHRLHEVNVEGARYTAAIGEIQRLVNELKCEASLQALVLTEEELDGIGEDVSHGLDRVQAANEAPLEAPSPSDDASSADSGSSLPFTLGTVSLLLAGGVALTLSAASLSATALETDRVTQGTSPQEMEAPDSGGARVNPEADPNHGALSPRQAAETPTGTIPLGDSSSSDMDAAVVTARGAEREEKHDLLTKAIAAGKIRVLDQLLVLPVAKGEAMSWHQAARICRGRTTGGFDDWSLPDRSELRSLARTRLLPAGAVWSKISDPTRTQAVQLDDVHYHYRLAFKEELASAVCTRPLPLTE